jgi:hypothetical protein
MQLVVELSAAESWDPVPRSAKRELEPHHQLAPWQRFHLAPGTGQCHFDQTI